MGEVKSALMKCVRGLNHALLRLRKTVLKTLSMAVVAIDGTSPYAEYVKILLSLTADKHHHGRSDSGDHLIFLLLLDR